ncbi:DNA polymerase II large subunit, partial [Candidatus Woesearchaeota archaeon]|nr:DNA polymerase II large subunit [Candidatus Woesearchaeota archaeon]
MTEETQSKKISKYFSELDKETKDILKISKEARKRGLDPEKDVEVPIACNMAERVIGLISAIAPKVADAGIEKRITELEKQYGNLDWRVAFKIAEEIAQQKFVKFDSQIEAMEIGIRIGFAYITLGVVSSPLEGFACLKVFKREDGKEYIGINYAGPIRSAGGTMGAASVLIVDYVRKKMGYAAYDATEKEIKRMSTELYDYHERVTNLQYLPSKEEIEFLTKHIPVQVVGEPSEKLEVSNYKDLPRVETNTIRNGVCLVIGECLCQKAPKLWKQLARWGKDFDMDQWHFLEEFLKIQKKARAGKEEVKSKEKVPPDYNYIKDLPAGRPVLCHPKYPGGFRLRYGRSRASGLSSMSISPVTMLVLDEFIGVGTQIKYERPGKSTAVAPCDTIEGPIVKLEDGTVIRLETKEEARKFSSQVEEILFLGDMLVNYGEFLNRAHVLVSPGYCEEWWVQELEKATVDMFGNLDLDKLSSLVGISKDSLDKLLKLPFRSRISAEAAVQLSRSMNIPLHPYYTYHWNLIDLARFGLMLEWFDKGKVEREGDKILKIVLPLDPEPKRALELIGMPHLVVNNEFVVIEKGHAHALMASLGVTQEKDLASLRKTVSEVPDDSETSVLEILSKSGDVRLRDKSGLFIGGRMGRPEKAKMRKLTGSPHVLFPVGEEGGRLRCFQAALDEGRITADFPVYKCTKCEKETISPICEHCG